ncbi:MAG: hypothetical protein A2020_03230 [Lentisphaerae bacterium GWF2_45_14]|nr:MAG: hypothetical protein A2020_03230 [Lentisphaerae bacterium GWF2_45_14]
MDRKVKVGIIGLGFMGTTHFSIYKSNPKAEIVAIADVNPDKLKGDISSVIGNIGGGDNSKPLDLNGIKTYRDGMDLINDPEVELVDICVPLYLHKKYATAALEINKNVLCEKPLAANSSEAMEILHASEKSKGFIMTGMCIRFWPEYRHAYELINSGKAGKVISATLKRLSPNIDGNSWKNWFMKSSLSGGAIYDLHLHDTDAIRYFFGMPESVTSFGVKGVRSDSGIDHVMTRYNFGKNSLITAEGGWDAAKGTPFEMSFQIVCEKMTIRLSESGYKVIHENGKIEEPKPAIPELPTGWHVEIDYMLDCVKNGVKPEKYTTLRETVDSIKMVEAEMKSIETDSTVKL